MLFSLDTQYQQLTMISMREEDVCSTLQMDNVTVLWQPSVFVWFQKDTSSPSLSSTASASTELHWAVRVCSITHITTQALEEKQYRGVLHWLRKKFPSIIKVRTNALLLSRVWGQHIGNGRFFTEPHWYTILVSHKYSSVSPAEALISLFSHTSATPF